NRASTQKKEAQAPKSGPAHQGTDRKALLVHLQAQAETAAAAFAGLNLIDHFAVDVAAVEAHARVLVVEDVVAEGADTGPFILKREVEIDGVVGRDPRNVGGRRELLAAIDIVRARRGVVVVEGRHGVFETGVEAVLR